MLAGQLGKEIDPDWHANLALMLWLPDLESELSDLDDKWIGALMFNIKIDEMIEEILNFRYVNLIITTGIHLIQPFKQNAKNIINLSTNH